MKKIWYELFNAAMIVKSHSERLNELLGLLDLEPDLEQIGSFLSKSSDPYGEICGISVMRLEPSGLIKDELLIGFKVNSGKELKLNISDDYPAAVALRTNTLQLADLTIGGAEYRDLPQVERLEDYRSGIILPVSDSLLFGLALTSSVEEIRKHLDYFEVVRKLLSQYLIRKKFESKTSSHLRREMGKELTRRQSSILDMIKEGRTNGSIASILGYSESPIRQETIIIYKKLGVDGRKELLNQADTNLDEPSNEDPDL